MCVDVAKFGIHNNVPQKPRATTIPGQTLRLSTKRGQCRGKQSEEKESLLDPAVPEARLTCRLSFPVSEPINIIFPLEIWVEFLSFAAKRIPSNIQTGSTKNLG